MNSQRQVLLIAGIVFVAAAIVGGGISWKDLSIPKIVSRQRQYLLGAFGAFLFLIALEVISADLRLDFLILWAVGFFGGFVATSVRGRKYEKWSQEHRDSPEQLIEDAKTIFWQGDYKWTIRFVLQAKEAARSDSWQSGYAFLLGAQLARRQKEAVATRIEIIDSIQKAVKERSGYFSSEGQLHQLTADLAAIKSKIARDDMAASYAKPIRAEIDRVIQATK